VHLLILTHSKKDPSFRVRWGRFVSELGDVEVREIGSGRRRLWKLARHAKTVVLHRRLLTARDFRALRQRARRLIYDFDDALCFRPDPPHRSFARERRFFRTVGRADVVLAGNRYLARLARLRAKRVMVFPSTVDVPEEPAARQKLDEFTAVWIGQRVTLPHLESVREAILATGVKLRVIADAAPDGAELVPWSLETEKQSLAECHVGLMPLPATPFTRGKCGFKLLQYYAAGLPAIASPVGVNRALAGGGAILARGPAEWAVALERLANDAPLRAELGAKGRAFVARRYAAGPLLERLKLVALQ
jgi:glycosyltransferase involved in cell wall biosynthesis